VAGLNPPGRLLRDHPRCRPLRGSRGRELPRPFPRHRDPGRAARVPAASDRDWFATIEHQRDRDGAPVLFQGDARPAGDDAPSRVRLRAAQAAARALARRGVAPAGDRRPITATEIRTVIALYSKGAATPTASPGPSHTASAPLRLTCVQTDIIKEGGLSTYQKRSGARYQSDCTREAQTSSLSDRAEFMQQARS
jgi:hypothetical protein